MSGSASIPTWVAVVVAVATPVLAFVGALTATVVSRKGASELESRSRREETMRTLKWAAELAVSDDSGKADLGLRELQALGESSLLDPEQQTFIDAALASVYGPVESEIEAAERAGEEVVVVIDAVPTEEEPGDESRAPRRGPVD